MPDNIIRPSKQPEKNTAISQMVDREKNDNQGKNGSKQKSIYLTDEHIKAIAIIAALDGVSKSIVIQ